MGEGADRDIARDDGARLERGLGGDDFAFGDGAAVADRAVRGDAAVTFDGDASAEIDVFRDFG